MRDGQHFAWPTEPDEYCQCWDKADELSEDMVPQWMQDNDEDPNDFRYVLNVYLRHDDQESYNEELHDWLEDDPYLIPDADADAGDGCVTHVYIRRPEGR